MADPELVRVMDYILNRCDEAAIEAVAAAVVRRRRELTMFGGARNLPDPKKLAKEMTANINIEGTVAGLKQSVLDYAVRIIKQEAPELTDDQIKQLTDAWIPDPGPNPGGSQGEKLPPDLLSSMIGQFLAYSSGTMGAAEDQGLRRELGAWPERYWKAFPQLIRLLITDYLKNEISEREFRSRLDTALTMRSSGSLSDRKD
ncbi:hypothetical protein AGMMS49587_09270 [Spirochaetia bacterium]|nr:hypothetical protein AGMMS49587_09270 [Spirochaetia bacterium]